jgi:hypothetical protein
MIIDFYFPDFDPSLISLFAVGMDNFPNNKPMKPELLDLARNISLQMGHSSTFPQKEMILIVFKSVVFN